MNVIYLGNQERKKKLAAELERITGALQKNPTVKKVILFGSLAGGQVGIKSDLDLLVIQDTDKPFLSRSIDLMQQFNPSVAVDLLVYTPQEFAEMQKKPDSLIRDILKNGRVVYEKAGAGDGRKSHCPG
ncbi:MAG TPA: nucleotidyltransferase domain-containing protein [Bacillota bacterium]|nr:nucleotidyltransferase domain-containing protein [Bacillota bacterium]